MTSIALLAGLLACGGSAGDSSLGNLEGFLVDEGDTSSEAAAQNAEATADEAGAASNVCAPTGGEESDSDESDADDAESEGDESDADDAESEGDESDADDADSDGDDSDADDDADSDGDDSDADDDADSDGDDSDADDDCVPAPAAEPAAAGFNVR